MVRYIPFKIEAIDLAPRTWQEVLVKMRQGDVRRAWIPEPNGKVAIMDFEIQRVVIPTAGDYPNGHSKKKGS